MQNLIAKIKMELDQEMKANKVYKQSMQIRKIQGKHETKKRLFEEKRKAWEKEFERLKEDLENKFYREFPDHDYI
jgi:hypothetical protein